MRPVGGVHAGHVDETRVDEELEGPDGSGREQRRRIREDRRARSPGRDDPEIPAAGSDRGDDELEDRDATDDLRVARGLVARTQPGVAPLVLEEHDRVLLGGDVERQRDRGALGGTDVPRPPAVRADDHPVHRIEAVAPQRVHQQCVDVARCRQVDRPRARGRGAVGVGVRDAKPAADERRRRHSCLLRRRWKPPKDTRTPRVHPGLASGGEFRQILCPYGGGPGAVDTSVTPSLGKAVAGGAAPASSWRRLPGAPDHRRVPHTTTPRRADMSTTVLGAHHTQSLIPLENRSDTPPRGRLGARALRR